MQRAKTIILVTAMATLLCSAAVLAQDQYPPAGYDVVNTSANVSIYDPADPATLMEVVAMDGRAVIYRGDPYDAGGGILTIDTRMDTLILRGYSLSFGDSVFAVLDRSGPLSTGQIWQLTAHVDFPAESFFDVYYKLTFTTEPVNPSPGDGSDDDVTRHGSFNYDLQSQSGSMVSGKVVPLTNKRPQPRPAQDSPDKGTRQGGEDIGSATYIPALPYGDGGNTCQNVDDYDEVCPYTGSTAPDVVYAYDPPLDTFITISTCNMAGSYDTKIYVYENVHTPNAPYACNDDACPDYTSIIDCMPVSANSTYYIVIDGYGTDASNCGEYELTVEYCLPSDPCVIDCDAASYQEQEPCGDDDNGGCNSDPNQFEPIQCGMDVCGTAYAEADTRDTDWYSFTIASEMIIEVTGSAEFPYIIGFVDTSDCLLASNVDPVAVGLPCDTQTVSRVAGPGTYYVFVSVNDYNNYPCGDNSDYFFQLRCYPTDTDLTPVDPPHMIDTIWQVPPHGRVYVDPRKTPVVNAAGDTIAWVWHEHIVDPPDSGQDTVPTIGIMSYWQGPNPPGGTQPPDETVELVGQAIISRGEVVPGETGRMIQTEILSMDLSGESAELGPMILSLPFPAPGMVTSDNADGQFFPAESFFDVYYQVDLPAMGLTIEPIQPPRMATTVEALPPVDNQYNDQNGEPHPVHDVQNPGVPIGWILPIHWVQPRDTTPPPPPPDTIPTIGRMPVIVGPTAPVVGQAPDETIHLVGDVIIQRGDEYDDPAGGQHVIETEILSMDLTGESNLFGPTILSLPQPAAGQIVIPIGAPEFPAESFFDVYYEVELPDQGQTIAPAGEPPYMHAEINALPPGDVQYVADDWHPVHDVQNPGVIIGWVRPIHWVNPPPTGACCEEQTGVCFIMTADECGAFGGTYQGDGSQCEPNPCEQPCPTGWYPGTSIIQYSAFQVDIFDPNDNSYLGTAYAFGAGMVVQYNTPYEVTPGIWRMDVDILAFAGAGNSTLLGGPFQLSLNPQLTSSGYIQMCDSCDDNWAESHFDINYRINTLLPPPNNLYYGNALMDLPCSENWDPYDGAGDFNPPDGHTYVDPRKVPIYNDAGEIIGYTMKRHRVDKEPLGACCEDGTGLCFIMTQVECQESGGMYMGDNVSCDPNPCPQPGGACCEQGTGLCFVMTQADCEAAQGTYMGDGVPCDPNPCTCCMGPIRGNIDYDALDQIDISDLVYLVDYMFNGGPAPQCWAEANVDCSDAAPLGDGSEDIDISDLVYLVDYMFTGGPPPCPCDCVPGEPCWIRGEGSSSTMGEETRRKWSSHVAPTTPAISLIGAVR